jgi:aspartate carbamoyltransferase catalytic subunit
MEAMGVKVFHHLEAALEGADVVMALRIQQERLAGALLPSLREYSRTFDINPRVMANVPERVLVMHPGPMNRGVEIDPSVADGPHSVVLDQVEAGVAIRMAILYQLAGEAGAAPVSA